VAETLLTISTATRNASVALTSGEDLLAELTVNPPGTQSEVVLTAVEYLLAELSLSLEAVDAIAVVNGPGAFTGLRVGVSTAKGLALAVDKPLVGVSTLQALAMQAPDVSIPVFALIDARKNEVYAAQYHWQEGVPELVDSEIVADPERVLAGISGHALFIGDGSTAYRTLIVRQLGDRACFAPWSANILRAGSAAMLALAKYRNSEVSTPELLNPVYIRPSDAEINLKTGSDSRIEG